ncbi:MAG: FecR domain-containing protein [Terriglobia bacterium]
MQKTILVLACLLLALPAAAAEQPIALLTHATGEVLVRHGADWIRVDTVPVDLFNGDKVATEQGRAEVYFWRDGSTLVLDVGTNLTVSEVEDGVARKLLRRIQIFLGDVWFELRRSFRTETELVTPTAVGGLRGTKGLVRVLDEGQTEFTLVEGELEVISRTESPAGPAGPRRRRLRARQVLQALRGRTFRVQRAGVLPRRFRVHIPVEQLPKLREKWRELMRKGERPPPRVKQLPPLSHLPGFIPRQLLRRELERQARKRERAQELLKRQPQLQRHRPQRKRQREQTRRVPPRKPHRAPAPPQKPGQRPAPPRKPHRPPAPPRPPG